MSQLEELDQKVCELYAELLKSAYERIQAHKQASKSLEEAIKITHELTLKFLRDHHISKGIGDKFVE